MSSAVMLKFGSTFSLATKKYWIVKVETGSIQLGTLQDNSDQNNLGLLPTRPTRESVQ